MVAKPGSDRLLPASVKTHVPFASAFVAPPPASAVAGPDSMGEDGDPEHAAETIERAKTTETKIKRMALGCSAGSPSRKRASTTTRVFGRARDARAHRRRAPRRTARGTSSPARDARQPIRAAPSDDPRSTAPVRPSALTS
jgi:hypothetical protein